MHTRPHLVRSIPFWALVVASLATAAAGAFVLTDKLGTMTTTLTDGSATGVDVYVGQSIAVLGAVLLGAGIIGVLLSLVVAAAASLRPQQPAPVVEPIDWSADEAVDAEEPHVASATTEPAVPAEHSPADADSAPLPTSR
jgi:hypothetical protein